MGIYWRVRSIPELKGLSEARRDELFRLVNRRLWPAKIVWAVVFALIQIVNPLVSLDARFRAPRVRGLPWIILAASFCWIAVLPPLVNGKAHGYLRQILAGCCANCGYDLRATPGRCPECGKIPRSGDEGGSVPANRGELQK